MGRDGPERFTQIEEKEGLVPARYEQRGPQKRGTPRIRRTLGLELLGFVGEEQIPAQNGNKHTHSLLEILHVGREALLQGGGPLALPYC